MPNTSMLRLLLSSVYGHCILPSLGFLVGTVRDFTLPVLVLMKAVSGAQFPYLCEAELSSIKIHA